MVDDVLGHAGGILGSVGILAPTADVTLHGTEFFCDSPHRLEAAASIALAAQAQAAATLWSARGGTTQSIEINRSVAIHALDTGLLQSIDGHDVRIANGARAAVSDFYRTGDGRWVHPMGTYPALRDGILELLDCANTKDAIARALSGWTAPDFEDALGARGLAGNMVRTTAEWRDHPQGKVLMAAPLIEIEKIGDAPPRRLDFHERPLGGVRVVDFSHVIAGPVLARTLAGDGADVMRVNSPRFPDPMEFILDTGWGKRSTYLDLAESGNRDRMDALLSGANIFIESWRPSALAGFGLNAAALAERHPGMIHVSVSAFGRTGPWQLRKGFEQLAQSVSGMCIDESGPDARPRFVPTGLLADYLAGYFGAIGAVAALLRQQSEGGSYSVHVSLTRLAMWVQDLGLVSPRAGASLPQVDTVERDTPFGRLRHLSPIARFSLTPARWDLPPCPAGAHPPLW